ncbi:unnamed protein product [Caenorhabditis bovis]|uniref:Ubiquitin-like protease family profile domain-containing protein n=1 Tax=Caenorhabditis bovis TaxID=2654633 RepID=A0A8S1ESW9_9PELO|nr:unnamed protein product [Caenorhabditis bovis]
MSMDLDQARRLVSESVSRRDTTFRAKFFVYQSFIGNIEVSLKTKRHVTFYFNRKQDIRIGNSPSRQYRLVCRNERDVLIVAPEDFLNSRCRFKSYIESSSQYSRVRPLIEKRAEKRKFEETCVKTEVSIAPKHALDNKLSNDTFDLRMFVENLISQVVLNFDEPKEIRSKIDCNSKSLHITQTMFKPQSENEPMVEEKSNAVLQETHSFQQTYLTNGNPLTRIEYEEYAPSVSTNGIDPSYSYDSSFYEPVYQTTCDLTTKYLPETLTPMEPGTFSNESNEQKPTTPREAQVSYYTTDVDSFAEFSEFFTVNPMITNDTDNEAALSKRPKLEQQNGSNKEVTRDVVSLEDDGTAKANQFSRVSAPYVYIPGDENLLNEELFYFPPKNVDVDKADHILVCIKDVHTLERCEFVNDVIISFMINYLYFYRIPESLRSKIHIFNTFFYSRLTKNVPPMSLSGRKEIREGNAKIELKKSINYLSKWTKKFDLFEKEFVVIPVNEDYHWLLMVIVNPNGAIIEVGNEEESRKKQNTYIVFIDPLSGLDPSRRRHMGACLKEYLIGLFENTKTKDMKFAPEKECVFDASRVEVIRLKNTPIQKNFYDCGLYLLHYIEALFCDIKPVKTEEFPDFNWEERFPESCAMADLMRDKVYNLIQVFTPKKGRSRLERFERRHKRGLGTEGPRRHRRHSAAWPRNSKRNEAYYRRAYSLSPPPYNVQELVKEFNNPREIATMPITRRVREISLQEYAFPPVY